MPNKVNKIWDIKEEEFPVQGDLPEQIKFVLRYGILAPSTHNTQPWYFVIENDHCKIYYDKNRQLNQADPDNKDLFISLGCLHENICLAAQYFGILKNEKLSYQFGQTLVSQIFFQLAAKVKNESESIVKTMTKRKNVRGFFDNKNLPSDLQERINEKIDENIQCQLYLEKEKIDIFGNLTGQAVAVAHKNKLFRQELAQWMRPNNTKKKDGLVGYNLRLPYLMSLVIPWAIKNMNMGSFLGKLNQTSIQSAAGVCLLKTSGSTPGDWWSLGRNFQRLSLFLWRQNIKTSIYVAAVENEKIVEKLTDKLHCPWQPDFAFTLGYMDKELPHSPRLCLESRILKHI